MLPAIAVEDPDIKQCLLRANERRGQGSSRAPKAPPHIPTWRCSKNPDGKIGGFGLAGVRGRTE